MNTVDLRLLADNLNGHDMITTLQGYLATVSQNLGEFVAAEYCPDQTDNAVVDLGIKHYYVDEQRLNWVGRFNNDYCGIWGGYADWEAYDLLQETTDNGTFEEFCERGYFGHSSRDELERQYLESAVVIVSTLFDMCRNCNELFADDLDTARRLSDAVDIEEFCDILFFMRPHEFENCAYLIEVYQAWMRYQRDHFDEDCEVCKDFLCGVLWDLDQAGDNVEED